MNYCNAVCSGIAVASQLQCQEIDSYSKLIMGVYYDSHCYVALIMGCTP